MSTSASRDLQESYERFRDTWRVHGLNCFCDACHARRKANEPNIPEFLRKSGISAGAEIAVNRAKTRCGANPDTCPCRYHAEERMSRKRDAWWPEPAPDEPRRFFLAMAVAILLSAPIWLGLAMWIFNSGWAWD